jgi:hypothetical protein
MLQRLTDTGFVMMFFRPLITTLVFLICGAQAFAQSETVSDRTVTMVGCHAADGTCFVNLDGPYFGASLGCAQVGSVGTYQFRFDNADVPTGRKILAAFMAAHLSGRKVTVAFSGCSVQGAPKPHYYYVH